jgi:parallel beta-helix repeat protein
MTWTVGDVSGSETLEDVDHIYPSHVNELRSAVSSLLFTKPYSYIIYLDGSVWKAVNGVTLATSFSDSDFATVVNDVLDELTSGGRILISYIGEITVNSSIWMRYSNTILEGCGWSTVLKAKDNLNDDVIICSEDPDELDPGQINPIYSSGVRNLFIEGNGDNQSAVGSHGGTAGIWDFYGDYNMIFENIYINNTYGTGFYPDNTHHSTIRNVHCVNCKSYGIQVYSGGHNKFSSCFARSNLLSGIYLKDTYYNSLAGVEAYMNQENGIILYQANDTYRTWNMFSNCDIRRNGKYGIRIEGAKGNSVLGCSVLDNSYSGAGVYSGIYLTDSETGNYATENKIEGCQIGNEATQYQKYGITEADANQDFNIIVGNSFYNNLTAAIDQKGVNDEIDHNIGA